MENESSLGFSKGRVCPPRFRILDTIFAFLAQTAAYLFDLFVKVCRNRLSWRYLQFALANSEFRSKDAEIGARLALKANQLRAQSCSY